jgi:hypothetical protein
LLDRLAFLFLLAWDDLVAFAVFDFLDAFGFFFFADFLTSPVVAGSTVANFDLPAFLSGGVTRTTIGTASAAGADRMAAMFVSGVRK